MQLYTEVKQFIKINLKWTYYDIIYRYKLHRYSQRTLRYNLFLIAKVKSSALFVISIFPGILNSWSFILRSTLKCLALGHPWSVCSKTSKCRSLHIGHSLSKLHLSNSANMNLHLPIVSGNCPNRFKKSSKVYLLCTFKFVFKISDVYIHCDAQHFFISRVRWNASTDFLI